MNILNYLTPSFEDFVDAPVGVDQLAHNSAGPAGEAPAAVAPATTEAPADSLEIPETVGPALVASADEVQAATIVEDPSHSEAEQAAQQASDADTAVIEQAPVAPAETGTTETPGEEGTGDAESTELGGDVGASDALGDGSTTDGELGGDAPAGGDELGAGELSDETGETTGDESGLGETEGTGEVSESADDGLGELGATATEGDTGAVGETADATTTEEDGLGEPEPTEGEEDGLGDGAESGSEGTGEETETEETSEAEEGSETEGEESSGEEESTGEAEGEETEGSEEEAAEGTETEGDETGEEETDSDDDVDLDIPDVDTETTEDDVVEAEEEAAEAVAEDEDLDDEIVDTSKSVEELEDEEVAVEEFIGVLQHGIRTKRFNAQTVALAQSKLQRLCGKFQEESPVIPSMEDYSEQNLGEYYTNSLESFSSFLKKIKHARDSFMDNFAKKMNDKIHLKAVETYVAGINKALDVQIIRVKDLELKEAATVKVPAPIRGEGGPLKAVTAELQWLGEVANVFSHDRKWLEGVAGQLSAAVKEGDALKSTSTINKALKLPLPVKSYPASVFTGSSLSAFTFNKAEKKATGSLVEDMSTLGDRAIPAASGGAGKGSGPDSVTMKKADLVKALQLAKVLIGLSRGTAGAAGKGIVETIDVVNRSKSELNQKDAKSGDAQTRAANEKALSKLVTEFWTGLSNSTDNYSMFQWHIAALADNLVRLVAKVK
jgi:hypothetical protein